MRKKKGAKNREKAKGSLEKFSVKARLRSKRPRRRSIGGSLLLWGRKRGQKTENNQDKLNLFIFFIES
ncbi:hypothetical protein [Anaerotignum sp.]|uniref:hypothetical protein n=1 Tax=Anaerotignum sp. TaxID=2039241 RepID=UPI0027151074|nr:hypothetical protein [Anaerotignum sp.]